MDYAFDFYFNGVNEQFVYDDHRYFSKLYVFLKSLGLVLYTTTLTRCKQTDFYIMMISVMFASLLNSARYEYKHFQRYRTTFSSIAEFETWKASLWPKSRVLFSIIEVGIKIGYLIKTFPPMFDFRDVCDAGESVFKIHIMVVIGLYIIVGIFSMFLLTNSCCHTVFSILCCCCYNDPLPQFQSIQAVHVPLQISLPIHRPSPVVLNTSQECCICMDNDCIQSWSSLPCGHMFHASCVSRWINTHHTCPVCRFDMRIIV